MSYYFGLLEKDLTIVCCDRTRVEYRPERVQSSDSPRYSFPFPNIVFCPTGNLQFSIILKGLMVMFGCEEDLSNFQIENLMSRKKEFQDLANSSFEQAKSALSKKGEAPFNSDTLFGGIGFLGCVSSENKFELGIATEPGSLICLRQKPEILDMVSRNLKIYLGGASGLPIPTQKELAKKFLPKVLHYVSSQDPRVSWEGDLIFNDQGGCETFEFGREGITDGP